jgi:hypothetical protein
MILFAINCAATWTHKQDTRVKGYKRLVDKFFIFCSSILREKKNL